MFCTKCGAHLETNAQFCSMCGTLVEAEPKASKNSSSENSNCFPRHGKIIIVALAVLLLISCVFNIVQLISSPEAPNKKTDEGVNVGSEHGEYDGLVEKATNALKSKWIELYEKSEGADGYLAIYNTRVVDITPDNTDTFFQEMDRGMEIDYIVEFSVYSDYFSAAPYYFNAGTNDTVIVYEDGTTSVASNFFRIYSSKTYSYDFSGFIKSVHDLGSKYNRTFHLS